MDLLRGAKSDKGNSRPKQFETNDLLFLRYYWTCNNRTIRALNFEWYTTICLQEVLGEIRKKKRQRRIILHHDNASSHTSAAITTYLSAQNPSIELMGHPPYSPDLAPNYFFSFPHVKNKLRGQRFSAPEEAVDEFKNRVLEVPQSEWKKCFENWFDV
ncbi:unnamed protein product [Euphydryas editha]|uniref:Tc1-like transposase DDE domain-containing protein n=1 Tax=Euphydryas editha TaxID=104508 RepID=A0AAU9TKA8_EUPED|nr:unnamed protein product [Euphydryas editha]